MKKLKQTMFRSKTSYKIQTNNNDTTESEDEIDLIFDDEINTE